MPPRRKREIPRFTLEGVSDAEITTYPVETEDGLGLHLFRFQREPCEDAVMLLHGLTTSTDMFIMPEHENLVGYLLDNGYTDVWCFDYRMSNRHSYNMQPNRYTLDDVALYDHPAAVETIREHIGPDTRLHTIGHCLGAVSFAMSLFGGLVNDEITSAILNSVSLRPNVPTWSKVKLWAAPFLMEYLLDFSYVSPRWRNDPYLSRGKLLSYLVSAFHHECDDPTCHMLSFMWGDGRPALYSHDLLNDVTHDRGADLYGPTSLHYYRHVRKMVSENHRAVKYAPSDNRYDALPDDYLAAAGDIDVPTLFCTGTNNQVFTNSNILAYETMEEKAPGRHELATFEEYGHQDVFMGENVHRDIFPTLIDFMKSHQSCLPNPEAQTRASDLPAEMT